MEKFRNYSILLPSLVNNKEIFKKINFFNFSNFTNSNINKKFNKVFCNKNNTIKFLFKLKMTRQKYNLNNKFIYLDRFIINKQNFLIDVFFKKKLTKTDSSSNYFNNKSKNLYLNKYLPKKLNNIFISLKKMLELKKIIFNEPDDLNYRGFGLGKQLQTRKINWRTKKARIKKLKPNTFFYWKHLRWFNIFINQPLYYKIYYNKYFFFKDYEKFRKINYYFLFKFHKKLKYVNNNSCFTKNFKINFAVFKKIIYYNSFLKSKSKYTNNKLVYFDYKKKLFNKWSHLLKFSIVRSKRLHYIPYKRYKKIKDNIFMWRVYSRKVNKLKRFFLFKTKIFKKKLKNTKNEKYKTDIISYLKLIKTNFNAYKVKSFKEIPILNFLKKAKKKIKTINKIIIYYAKIKKSLFLKKNKKFNNTFFNYSLLKIIFNKSKKLGFYRKNVLQYVKKFIEHLFFIIFKLNNLRLFYIKMYKMNIMGTKAKLFKNLFNFRLATGFKVPFLIKIICRKLSYDKGMVGCKIGFFGRYSRRLRNRKIWRFIRHIKPSVISTPLDYYNVIILQKWGITGIKLSMLRKKVFNFVFNN